MTRTRPVLATIALAALAAAASAQTIQPPFDADYSYVNLGNPSGIPGPLGGITFDPTDANRVLIGGSANQPAGAVYAIAVVRDAQQHIVAFSGAATLWSTAPNIDGGLAFAPNSVLFATGYNTNKLHQIPMGQSAPAKTIDLNALGIASSVGTLQFTPPGYVGAGKLRIASYNAGTWYSADIVPDGAGTFDLANITTGPTLQNGPEGILYPPAGSPQFADGSSVLVNEYGGGQISVYQLDANGDPIVATRQAFMIGLGGAEGATRDPVTGDFLFTTFGGANTVIAVRGFPACSGKAVAYGAGVAGSGGFVPSLAAVSVPCVGNSLAALSLQGGLGGTLCVVLLGTSAANIPVPYYGGTVLVAQSVVNSIVLGGTPGVPGDGGFTVRQPIQNDVMLSGTHVYLQAILLDPGAVRGCSFTAGIDATIG